MTRKYIFHIGPPKTGTSSLQESLFHYRDQLSDQGYEYPAFGRHADMQRLPGHHGFADSLRRHGRVPAGVLENLQQVPSDRTVIFSSENFAHVTLDGIRALNEAFGAENIEVIYYARRWDQLLPSVWQELVKHGHSGPYLEFLNSQISAPMASIYLNYVIILDRWAQIMGARNIRLFSYENISSAKQDIVQHFCTHVLGLNLQIIEQQKVNQRQPTARTETLRMLNRLSFGGGNYSPKIRFALEQHLELVHDDLVTLEKIYKPYIAEAPVCAPFVFRHVERQFLKAYGHRVENLTANGSLFPDRPLKTSRFVRQDYLAEDGVLPRFQALLKAIGQG
jgi:hypothetical protein